MAKRKLVLYNQRIPHETEGQTFTLASLTEPDQALTPAEILKNYRLSGRTGLDNPLGNIEYDEEGDLNGMMFSDKLEREDMRRGVQERMEAYNERMNAVSTTAAHEGEQVNEHVATDGEREQRESKPEEA